MLAKDNEGAEPRLGLAVAKKQVRLAVDRNRIKRVIRDSFRCHRQLLVGLDLVVLARKNTAGMSNDQLFSSLETHWQRLAKIK